LKRYLSLEDSIAMVIQQISYQENDIEE